MDTKKVFPLIRNQYTPGRRLTYRDFALEQVYCSSKRRLQNRLLFGRGIVSGFFTFKIDEQTLGIDSGMAIDMWGREVILPYLTEKKLATLDGFSTLPGNQALLCAAYSEEERETDLESNEGDLLAENRKNRMDEGCHFFLLPPEELGHFPGAGQRFLNRCPLFEGDGISVELIYPTIARMSENMMFLLHIVNHTEEILSVEFQTELVVPGMVGKEGTSNLEIRMEKTSVLPGGSIHGEYVTHVLESTMQNVCPGIQGQEVRLKINEIKIPTEPVLLTGTIAFCEESLAEVLTAKAQKVSLEDYFDIRNPDYVVLATVKFKRVGGEVLLEQVVSPKADYFANMPETNRIMEQLRPFYPEDQPTASLGETQVIRDREQNIAVNMSKFIATGVLELPLGLDAIVGSVFFTDEIMHGLGIGNVSVQVAVELYKEGANRKEAIHETISGASDIFKNKTDRSHLDLETAVKVFINRGSFTVGIRLLAWTEAISVTLRWFAVKAPEIERLSYFEEMPPSMKIVPDTMVLAPGETVTMVPVFSNMAPSPCTYELTNRTGGMIDNNGQYVAPAKEGVYEIRIKSVVNPNVKAVAFAVVKQGKTQKTTS